MVLEDVYFFQTTEPIITERRVYHVEISAILIDLREKTPSFPELLQPDPNHYPPTQNIGKELPPRTLYPLCNAQ